MKDTKISRFISVYGVFVLQFVVLIYFLPLIYSQLPEKDYALYGIAMTSTSLLQIFCFGYPQTIIREIINLRIKGESVNEICNTYVFIAAALVFFLSIISSVIITFSEDNTLALLFFVFTFFLYIFNELLHSFLLGYEKFTHSRLIKSAEFIFIIFSFVILIKQNITILEISFVYFLSALINLVLSALLFQRLSNFKLEFNIINLSIVREMWHSSKWYLLGGGITFCIFASDNYMMPYLFTSSVFVYFQPFMKAADATRTILSQVMAIFFTDIARLKEENNFLELMSLFKRLQVISILGSLFAFLGACLFGQEILGLWLGFEVSEEQFIFFLTCIVFVLLHILDSVPSTFAGALGIHSKVIIVAIIQVMAKFAALYLLLDYFGAYSLPLSGVVAFILTNFLFSPLYVRKYLSKNMNRYKK